MKSINLGMSGLFASSVALGCMRIADMKNSEIEKLIDTCLESGIDFFDHADIYGGGRCEEKFGEYLANHPNIREKIIVQTKCGIRPGFFDFSFQHIVSQAEKSLSKLKTDYLDILLLHRPDTLMEPEEVAEAFTKLHDEGKARYFGVSNQNPMQIELLQKYLPFKLIVNQVQFGPAHTPIVDAGLNVNIKSASGTMYDGGILEYCRLHNITIQTWSPFMYGFFEGVFAKSERYKELNETLDKIGRKYHVSPGAAAVGWIARHPAKIQTIIGSTNPQRVRENALGADIELTREEWYKIYRAAGNKLP